jgi:hypothetical protein
VRGKRFPYPDQPSCGCAAHFRSNREVEERLCARRKIPTSRHVNGSGACRGSSLWGRPNAFSRHTVPSPHISDHDATPSLPQCIARPWPEDSRSGGRSRARSWPPKGRMHCIPPAALPDEGISTNKLTMPKGETLNQRLSPKWETFSSRSPGLGHKMTLISCSVLGKVANRRRMVRQCLLCCIAERSRAQACRNGVAII